MGKKIGIDLGTTNSVAAIVDGPRPRVLDNLEANSQTPSVVGIKKRKKKKNAKYEETLIGETALDNFPMAPIDTITSVKRLMGRGIADPEIEKIKKQFSYEIVQPSDGTAESIRVLMDGVEYSPIDISAKILGKIKKDAEYRLGEEVTHAVVTVPAYFSQIQKKATHTAAMKAGLKVIRILDEPTAAAIAFGLDSGDSSEAKTILVYDLGGGTFDISILMWANDVFAPLNLEGDMWLGGDNFDQALIDAAIQHVKEEYEVDPTSNKRFMATLRKSARAAKERLVASRSADIIVAGLLRDDDGDLIDVDIEVTREEFDNMIRPFVDRTEHLVDEAIRNANLSNDDIDYVLMAGNSTTVPLVQDVMVNKFGPDKVKRNIHPKHCVALGAAVIAARAGEEIICYAEDPEDPLRECGKRNPSDATACERCGEPLGISIGNVAPFSYGTQTAGDKYNIFIKKNDPYGDEAEDPVVNTFCTQKPNQRMISIPVYGGDNLEKASMNEKQGEAFAILPPGLQKNTPVHIKLWLNANGYFELSAQLDDGSDLNPWIIHGESDQKAVEALQKMEGLIEEKARELPPERRQELDRKREAAFEKVKQERFKEALNDIEDIQEVASSPSFDLKEVAEQLVAFAQFILYEYQWILDPNKSYQINNLISDLKNALEKGDMENLETEMKNLESALRMPQFFWDILEIKGGVENRIRPFDPKKANDLLAELQAVEDDLKAGNLSATSALPGLKEEVDLIAREITPPDKDICPDCQAKLGGKRICPACGYDTWVLSNQQSGIPSSESIRRL